MQPEVIITLSIAGILLTTAVWMIYTSPNPKNKSMNTELEKLIANSKGRFFSITFKKKDGSIRTINGKNKYLAYLRGGESYGRAAGYVPFIDRNKNNWASAHKDSVLSFKCGQIEKTFSV
jgi:hypothetical protein